MKFRALEEFDATHGTVQLVDGKPYLFISPDCQQHRCLTCWDFWVLEQDSPLRLQHSNKSHLILIPQPSDDPNDPLRWPRWKKLVPLVLVNCFAFMVSWVITGLSTGFLLWTEEFDKSTAAITDLLSFCVLVLGLAVSVQKLLLIF